MDAIAGRALSDGGAGTLAMAGGTLSGGGAGAIVNATVIGETL